MTSSLTYQQMGTTDRGQAHALFAQTMAYVAATAALFALGAYLGRNLTGGVGIFFFIAGFACLIGMRFAARRSAQLTVALLLVFGLLIGLAVAPTIAYYGSMDPRALWEAGGATALFIAGFGAAGYATRRDLAPLARWSTPSSAWSSSPGSPCSTSSGCAPTPTPPPPRSWPPRSSSTC